jgi:transcriptional regulator with XRE-family HTH domain
MGMLQPQLSRLENGHVKDPDLATLKRHAEALEVDLKTVMESYAKTIERGDQ